MDQQPLVQLLRPSVWRASGHSTYSCAFQPEFDQQQNDGNKSATTSIDAASSGASSFAGNSLARTSSQRSKRRRRIATASGDAALGVCIWDLDELLAPAPAASSESSSSSSSAIAVKLESGISRSPSSRPGLLATLPQHLSAVNVVRWEPVIGERLASGSDLNTQSIIIWKRKEQKQKHQTTQEGEQKSDDGDFDADTSFDRTDSSIPYGLTHSSAPSSLRMGTSTNASSSSSSSDVISIVNRELWQPILSLHGQRDIQDLCWAPIGLHFPQADQDEMHGGYHAAAQLQGLIMDSSQLIEKRISVGIGSQVLASCSLDTSVVLWNTDTGDRHTLKGHTAWVIGLAFDPQGMILATQSIDGYVWIWSLTTFQLLRKLKNVGLPSVGNTLPKVDIHRTNAMARMSFTPDGTVLSCARGEIMHTVNKKKHRTFVNVILNRRKNFVPQCVFTGHTERTTVSAFNPVMFKPVSAAAAATSSTTGASFSILAIGGHDCTLSIWSTRSPRPLLLLTELFHEAILDLSWSSDGRTLLVSSHDGSIIVLQFTYTAFEGIPMTREEVEERMRALPIQHSTLASSSLPNGPESIQRQAETTAFVQKLTELNEKEMKQQQDEAARARALMDDSSGWGAEPVQPKPILLEESQSSLPIKSLQTEVRRADGKRRIVPVAVPTQVPLVVSSALPVKSSSSTAGRINLAAASDKVLLQLTGMDTTSTATNGIQASDLFAGSEAAIAASKNAGVKRKRPTTEESSSSNSTKPNGTDAANKKTKLTHPTVSQPRIKRTLLPQPNRLNRWLLSLPPTSTAANEDQFLTLGKIRTKKPSQWEFLVCDSFGRAISTSAHTATVASAPSASSSSATQSSQCTIITSYSVLAASADSPSVRQLVWESFLPLRVLMSKGNSRILVACCVDTHSNQYYAVILSASSGRQLYPPLLLTNAPFALTVHIRHNAEVFLILSCDGLCRVYDMMQQKKLTIQCSIRNMMSTLNASKVVAPAVTSAATGASTSTTPTVPSTSTVAATSAATPPSHAVRVVAARLTPSFAPSIVLSTQQTFIYDTSFESWMLHVPPTSGNIDAAVHYPASEMRSTLERHERTAVEEERWRQENASTLSAPTIQPLSSSASVSASLLMHIDSRTRIMQTIAQLESTLSLAMHGIDPIHYRQALTTYVAKLVSLYPGSPSALLKLNELCHELAGPTSAPVAAAAASSSMSDDPPSSAAASSPLDVAFTLPPRWQPFILGLSKRALLKGLIPLLRTNPRLADQLTSIHQFAQ